MGNVTFDNFHFPVWVLEQEVPSKQRKMQRKILPPQHNHSLRCFCGLSWAGVPAVFGQSNAVPSKKAKKSTTAHQHHPKSTSTKPKPFDEGIAEGQGATAICGESSEHHF